MRGLAVLTAAASCWVLVRGLPPVVGRLRLQPPDALGLALGAAAAIGVSFLAFALIGIPSVALALGILAASVPVTTRNERRRRAEASVRDRWPDVLMYIRSSLSAGGTLEDATIDAMQKVGAPFDTYAERVRAAIAFGGGYAHGMEAIREVADERVHRCGCRVDRDLVNHGVLARHQEACDDEQDEYRDQADGDVDEDHGSSRAGTWAARGRRTGEQEILPSAVAGVRGTFNSPVVAMA